MKVSKTFNNQREKWNKGIFNKIITLITKICMAGGMSIVIILR